MRGVLRRRSFLSLFPRAFIGAASIPLLAPLHKSQAQSNAYQSNASSDQFCWLDVCAPFIVEDAELGVHSEIVLTSDTFAGTKGYETTATEYEIYLYDLDGKPLVPNGTKRVVVPAMQTTVLKVRDIVGKDDAVWGGMRIRLRPKGPVAMHASDLFSSAFVRWQTTASFDNVHANPDPLEWQRPDSFFYSMPYPPASEYESIFSLFNPYAEQSSGAITTYDPLGANLKEVSYELKPYSTCLFDLGRGDFVTDAKSVFKLSNAHHSNRKLNRADSQGGTIVVTNKQNSVKSFGYLLIKRQDYPRFSVEHPIHQPPFNPVAAAAPFDAQGRFKAKNILYTPLLFRTKKFGGVTLESRFHFSSGAPIENHLWLNPFVTDMEGNVAWQVTNDTKLPGTIPSEQIERGVIKLAGRQSCIFDCQQIALPKSFAGALSLAIAPNSNHTLMKVEVLVPEWRAHAFTHFRPGLRSARGYQNSKHRGGLATDYIGSGAHLERNSNKILRDELIGIMNIDDRGVRGQPVLEVFTSRGFLTRINLVEIPSFGCRYYLLSELLPMQTGSSDLSLRLVDERATLLMSVLHLDYVRRDIALDHGSDRFSTFNDYNCDAQV